MGDCDRAGYLDALKLIPMRKQNGWLKTAIAAPCADIRIRLILPVRFHGKCPSYASVTLDSLSPSRRPVPKSSTVMSTNNKAVLLAKRFISLVKVWESPAPWLRLFSLYLCLEVAASSVLAAPGDGDATFPKTEFEGHLNAMQVTPEGEAFLAGEIYPLVDSPPTSLVKLLPSGEIDLEFSIGEGFKIDRFSPGILSVLALDSEGRIYAGGAFSRYDTVAQANLVRLHPNGELDTSFRPRIQVGQDRSIEHLHLTADGYIYIVADSLEVDGEPVINVARLFAMDGRRDPIFRVSQTPPTGSGTQIKSLPDRRVLARSAGIYRLWNDGTRDHGLERILSFAQEPITDFVPLPGGELLTLASASGKLVRWLDNGTVDPSFSAPSSIAGSGPLLRLPTGDLVIAGRHLLNSAGEQIATMASDPSTEDFVVRAVCADSQRLWVARETPFRRAFSLERFELFENSNDDAIEFVAERFVTSEDSKTVSVALRRSGNFDSTSPVTCRVIPESATEGEHYQGSEFTVSFAPNETTTVVHIPLITDSELGTQRTFRLRLISSLPVTLGHQTEASVTILDDDRTGIFSLVKNGFFKSEVNRAEGQDLSLRVFRSGGMVGAASVQYEIELITADPVDFTSLSGTVTFAADQKEVPFPEVVVDDNIVEYFREDAILHLKSTTLGSIIGGEDASLSIGILDDDRLSGGIILASDPPVVARTLGELPDGRIALGGRGENIRFEVRFPDGTIDLQFDKSQPNGSVQGVSVDSQGRILVCGEFTKWGDLDTPYVVRLLLDGSPDQTFLQDGSTGPNATVYRFVSVDEDRYLLAGEFTKFGDSDVSGLIKVFTDGTPDPAFKHNALAGEDGTSPKVEELEIFDVNRIFVGSQLFNVASLTNRHVIRIKENGEIDYSFAVESDTIPGTIECILPMPDGSVFVGGSFAPSGTGNILLLNEDGTKNSSFQETVYGSDGPINEIHLLPNGRLFIAGFFSRMGGGTSQGLAIVEPNGRLFTRFGSPFNRNTRTAIVSRDGRFAYTGIQSSSNSPPWRVSISPPANALYQSSEEWTRVFYGDNAAISPTFWSEDADGDGASNFDEWVWSTNPLKPDMRKPLSISGTRNSVLLEVPWNWSAQGTSLSIETSDDATGWLPLDSGSYSKSDQTDKSVFAIPLDNPPNSLRLFRARAAIEN